MAKGKRVKVKLRDGRICGDVPVAAEAKAGWPADQEAAGKGPPMSWRLNGDRHDVVEWDFA